MPDAHQSGDTEYVTLVDALDRVVGKAEKLQAHREGLLHRAVSVVLFDNEGRLLLQRRHPDKYHSGGLWSNTACGHPRPGESPANAAARRLSEEMGISCKMRRAFGFVYKTIVEDGMLEHEYDHVFTGRHDGDPRPNAAEVDEWRWAAPPEIAGELIEQPDIYTYWFRILFGHLAMSNTIDVTRTDA